MDVYESDSIRKHSTEEENLRLPLIQAETNNVPTTRRSRTREVSSRYKSPTPTTCSTPRRCPSPLNVSRTVSASSQLVHKRAVSVERKQPSTPPSPTSPSTRSHDLSADSRLSSRRAAGGRSAESLWPSTMRSLNVSFQSDIVSIPVSKKEKPVPASPSDRTLRPSSNVAHKLVEIPMVSRRPTPERKRSPLKGKNVLEQFENSKPTDGLHTRLIDQQRWPSRVGGKISLNALSRSVDLTDKIIRSSGGPLPGIGLSSLKKSSDSINRVLQKPNNDSTRILPLDDDDLRINALSRSVDLPDKIIRSSGGPLPGIGLSSLKKSSDSINRLLQKPNNDSTRILPLDEDDLRMNALSRSVDLTDKIIRSSGGPFPGIGLSSLKKSSDSLNKLLQKPNNDSTRILPLDDDDLRTENRTNLDDGCSLQASGMQKLPFNGLQDRLKSTPAIRPQSLQSPVSRLPSPIKTSVPSFSVTRGSSPAQPRPSTPPGRGVSPSRIRPTSSSQSNSSTSVLSFIADFKGKKGANSIEDAHQLRLLYNRSMQWRFSNARAEALLDRQKVNAERLLCNVWKAMVRIWDSVIRNKIDLQMLKLELKLNKIMNDQMAYLDEWDSLETEHINSLSGVLLDLEASSLRVPVTSGATADVVSLKRGIYSALYVMQAMTSSVSSLLLQIERVNGLVSELAVLASQERAILDECESLLASTTTMQVEEYSLRTHLIQMEQALENTSLKLLPHQYKYCTTLMFLRGHPIKMERH